MFFITRRVREINPMRMLRPGSRGVVFAIEVGVVVFVYRVCFAEEQEE